MPIRPEDRRRYPPNWRQIATDVKIRAHWRCQCDGRCGWSRCGTRLGRAVCGATHACPHPVTGSFVVLTAAHLDRQPENCAEDNLAAYCQGCHLHYDQDQHIESARAHRQGTPLINQPFLELGDDA